MLRARRRPAAILGAQYNVLQQLNLPRIPIDEGTATTAGIITLVAILLVTLLGAVLGGKLGERYHRKVDRAGFDRLTRLDRPRTARLSGAASRPGRVSAARAPTLPACAGTSDRSPTSSRRRRTTRSRPRPCSTSARSAGRRSRPGSTREAFDRAVAEVAAASTRLLDSLSPAPPPKDREVEAAKARERAALRYGT